MKKHLGRKSTPGKKRASGGSKRKRTSGLFAEIVKPLPRSPSDRMLFWATYKPTGEVEVWEKTALGNWPSSAPSSMPPFAGVGSTKPQGSR